MNLIAQDATQIRLEKPTFAYAQELKNIAPKTLLKYIIT